jgi:hypothetical protein
MAGEEYDIPLERSTLWVDLLIFYHFSAIMGCSFVNIPLTVRCFMGFAVPRQLSRVMQDELKGLIPGDLWKEVVRWAAADRRDAKHPRRSAVGGRGNARTKSEAEHRSKKRWHDPRRQARLEEEWFGHILQIAA